MKYSTNTLVRLLWRQRTNLRIYSYRTIFCLTVLIAFLKLIVSLFQRSDLLSLRYRYPKDSSQGTDAELPAGRAYTHIQ